MKLEINVDVVAPTNTLMARQIENGVMQRLAGLHQPRHSPVLCDAVIEPSEVAPQPVVPAAGPPVGSSHERTLKELNSLLATIIHLPSERKLREMRDLVDNALYALSLQAKRSNKLRVGWDRDCLHYTDDRLAAVYFRLPDGEWTGLFLGPNDVTPTVLASTFADASLARDALLPRLLATGAAFANPPTSR